MDERLILELLSRVRARWRQLVALRAVARAAFGAALVIAFALAAGHWIGRAPATLALLGVAAVVLICAVGVWGLWPLREVPSDTRVARFIEEANPSLDDRLASAVAVADARAPSRPAFAEPMLADAARRASAVDPASVVPRGALRGAALQAVTGVLVLACIGFVGRVTARQSYDALAFSLFPSHVKLDVTPGNVRLLAGAPLTIEARLSGNTAPVIAHLLRATTPDGNEAAWQENAMRADASGRLVSAFDTVDAPFRYRVAAGPIMSPVYTVSVARPPRVARIDLDYTFPKELGLAPRHEDDTGDIYAPAGSTVRVQIHTDRDVASGRLAFANGTTKELALENGRVLTGTLPVADDGSYRVALSDRDGLSSAGDTEYFVRVLEDRPPEVHLVHPARDRDVTPLEEVDIAARADDDFGIASMDLVYSVRGGKETVVPFALASHAPSVTGQWTLFLEDLEVSPGDFVSYYVRARDVSRGKQSSQTKSDLFFLQVRPFEQEFKLASSQGSGAGGGNRQIDDLVQAQKDVIVSTWKLDRRSEHASATSPADVQAVAKAESDLKTRVEETSSAFGETTLRDPRARRPQSASQARPGENDMTAAATSMGKAAASLGDLKTADAVSPEMDALNHLLRAQSEITERQIQTQPAGTGTASERSNLDLTNLFDRELQRQDQSNYEAKAPGQQDDTSALDKIRELAKRQDELNERQKALANQRSTMAADQAKRELEKLTRDQSDLRQKAEELAQSLGSQASQGSQSSPGPQGSQSGQGAMRAASDAMRNAANNLRQQNPGEASQQGAEASERLRSLAQQMESQAAGGANTGRRVLGDMQLEARELADAQRQIASSLERSGSGAPSGDAMRRLAGEEDGLADRAARMGSTLKQEATPVSQKDSAAAGRVSEAQSLASAARSFDQARTPERMKQAADAMRVQGSREASAPAGGNADLENAIARDLDRLAEALTSASAPEDRDAQRLADERSRADGLRAQMDALASQMKSVKDSATLGKLRDEYARQMQAAQQLLDQLKREDPSLAQAGAGFTFEGQGMTLSAPGTEAFKQDFAKWDQLRTKASDALSQVETSIDTRLEARIGKDRLAAGADDKAPPAYQPQVDSYFKALADRKPQ
jgi:hypothetical protein